MDFACGFRAAECGVLEAGGAFVVNLGNGLPQDADAHARSLDWFSVPQAGQ